MKIFAVQETNKCVHLSEGESVERACEMTRMDAKLKLPCKIQIFVMSN